MPVSASQYRASAGIYHNKTHNNLRGSAPQARAISSNHSAIPDDIRHFGNGICRAINSHAQLSRPSNQPTTPRQGVAAPLLMLLSQVRLADMPFSAAIDSPAQVTEMSSVASEKAASSSHGDNSGWTMLSPVTNALYKTGQFISRYVPPTFPASEATPLCAGSHSPDDFVNYLNTRGINVVARGLEQLKCIEQDKYEFFKGVSYNSVKVLDSAIKQLEDNNNTELDNHLRQYGFIDIDDVKPKLAELYKSIKSEINDTLNNKRDSLYYGYGTTGETAKFDAMVQLNDNEKRILLTDNFFGKCTINAVNLLIHEMSHLHTRLDLFQIIKQQSCLKDGTHTEKDIHAQLDDSPDFYTQAIADLKEENVVTDEHIKFVYDLDKDAFIKRFNRYPTVREDAIYFNADSISNLAIAIGNYGFKRDKTMPILDTSVFKTGVPLES